MSFPVMVDTKCREGSMSSRVFICEQSTRIICTRHTPNSVWPGKSVTYLRVCSSEEGCIQYSVEINFSKISCAKNTNIYHNRSLNPFCGREMFRNLVHDIYVAANRV